MSCREANRQVLRILLAAHLMCSVLPIFPKKQLHARSIVLPNEPLGISGRDTVMQIEGKSWGTAGHRIGSRTQRASTDEAR